MLPRRLAGAWECGVLRRARVTEPESRARQGAAPRRASSARGVTRPGMHRAFSIGAGAFWHRQRKGAEFGERVALPSSCRVPPERVTWSGSLSPLHNRGL